MNIRPLHDRVVVKRLEEDTEKTSGGLFIPESAKEKPQRGEVFAVGKGKREEGKVVPLDVQKGDQILFGKYSGSEVKLDGIEYLIMREDEILVVLDK
jgi:chaperonin GroES